MPKPYTLVTADKSVYHSDEWGVLHQIDAKPIAYDAAYLTQHTSKPNYKENSLILNGLRLGFLVGSMGYVPRMLLDYGYGDGSFAALAARIVPYVYGYDIGDYPIHSTCCRTKNPKTLHVEVVTYWDSLEHVPDLEVALDTPAKYVAVSVPCLPHVSVFEDWKHRRPNEHLHHFTENSLKAWMACHGWVHRASAPLEEAIRDDIITALFQRRD